MSKVCLCRGQENESERCAVKRTVFKYSAGVENKNFIEADDGSQSLHHTVSKVLGYA